MGEARVIFARTATSQTPLASYVETDQEHSRRTVKLVEPFDIFGQKRSIPSLDHDEKGQDPLLWQRRGDTHHIMTAPVSTKTISIQIPEGAEPGDTLEFQTPNGQNLELVVPSGSVPGDILEIQVVSDAGATDTDRASNEQEEESGIVKVDLGDGSSLEFVSELPADQQKAVVEEDHDDDDDENDGTYALPWQSGITLAQQWKDIQTKLLDRKIAPCQRVLELGSGLGLVGLSMAAELLSDDDDSDQRLLANNASICLTDVSSAMALLNFNVEHNKSNLSMPQNVSTRPLRWTLERSDDDPFLKEPPFDCLVGSDLLYNIESIPALIATIQRLLHPTRGIMILAVRWRKPDLERAFFRDSGLEWQLLLSETCQLSWQDFGNQLEASNKYFYQTQINVNGKPTALAEISQDQAKDLPPAEFQAWERSFIQIYLGQRQVGSLLKT